MMITTVKFAKVRPDAIIPTKRDEDMGFDIYPCFDEDYINILPHETKLIPTGIACACDKGYGLVLKERGSTGTKGMAQRCGIIDSGFRDPIFVPLTNVGLNTIIICKKEIKTSNVPKIIGAVIYPYEKAIAQALVVPVPEVQVEEYTYEELKAIDSERGCGKLGSSGK